MNDYKANHFWYTYKGKEVVIVTEYEAQKFGVLEHHIHKGEDKEWRIHSCLIPIESAIKHPSMRVERTLSDRSCENNVGKGLEIDYAEFRNFKSGDFYYAYETFDAMEEEFEREFCNLWNEGFSQTIAGKCSSWLHSIRESAEDVIRRGFFFTLSEIESRLRNIERAEFFYISIMEMYTKHLRESATYLLDDICKIEDIHRSVFDRSCCIHNYDQFEEYRNLGFRISEKEYFDKQEYRIIKNHKGEVVVVPEWQIYKLTYINTVIDGIYIDNGDGSYKTTQGYYCIDDFRFVTLDEEGEELSEVTPSLSAWGVDLNEYDPDDWIQFDDVYKSSHGWFTEAKVTAYHHDEDCFGRLYTYYCSNGMKISETISLSGKRSFKMIE